MRLFTNNPFERMMSAAPKGYPQIQTEQRLSPNHPCYGCSHAGQPCVGLCHRQMLDHLDKAKANSKA